MCAQVQLPLPEPKDPPEPPPEGAFGIPSAEAQESQRAEIYKELINKFAWVLGSTYRVNYSNTRMPARMYAQRIVGKVIADHGFPHSIAK